MTWETFGAALALAFAWQAGILEIAWRAFQ